MKGLSNVPKNTDEHSDNPFFSCTYRTKDTNKPCIITQITLSTIRAND